MRTQHPNAEFPEQADENRRIWNANALWWDDRIGDGNLARKTEGIIGQPEPQWLFHRSIGVLFRFGFDAGFVVDGIEEPGFPETEKSQAGVACHHMPGIPRSWSCA